MSDSVNLFRPIPCNLTGRPMVRIRAEILLDLGRSRFRGEIERQVSCDLIGIWAVSAWTRNPRFRGIQAITGALYNSLWYAAYRDHPLVSKSFNAPGSPSMQEWRDAFTAEEAGKFV